MSLKVVMISGQPSDSGCWLRTQYIGESLRKAGNRVLYIKPFRTLPFMTDIMLSIPRNTLRALFANCDIIMGVKPFPHVSLPLTIRKFLGSKAVIDIDDLDYGYRGGLLSFVSKTMQQPFPKHFDLVTYHNKMLRDHISSKLQVKKGNLYRLDQGVDLKTFDYKKKIDISKLKKKYGIKNEKIILYTGHLNIASDLEEILKAFRMVLKSQAHVKLIVAGGGPMETHFKDLSKSLGIADKTIFTSYIPKEVVASHILLADACVVYYKDIPVNYYRCSMKLRECMAMQKAVICNDVGDLKQFHEYTYQSRTNLTDFASTIVHVLQKGPDFRIRKAREYIHKNLAWDSIGKKFSKKLHSIV